MAMADGVFFVSAVSGIDAALLPYPPAGLSLGGKQPCSQPEERRDSPPRSSLPGIDRFAADRGLLAAGLAAIEALLQLLLFPAVARLYPDARRCESAAQRYLALAARPAPVLAAFSDLGPVLVVVRVAQPVPAELALSGAASRLQTHVRGGSDDQLLDSHTRRAGDGRAAGVAAHW